MDHAHAILELPEINVPYRRYHILTPTTPSITHPPPKIGNFLKKSWRGVHVFFQNHLFLKMIFAIKGCGGGGGGVSI